MAERTLFLIFEVTMKLFRNIATVLIALILVASCTKEVIVPAGNQDNVNKKGTKAGVHISVDIDDKGDNTDDSHNDGDITDPENDLDFD